MSFNLIEIAQAWITAANPTELQKKIAKERYTICLNCEHYRKSRPITHDEYCADCGCPLSKKIFSAKYSACQLGNWEIVDKNYSDTYFEKKKAIKKNKTLL
jgi:hypothetical protein